MNAPFCTTNLFCYGAKANASMPAAYFVKQHRSSRKVKGCAPPEIPVSVVRPPQKPHRSTPTRLRLCEPWNEKVCIDDSSKFIVRTPGFASSLAGAQK